ncbi:MAG: NAD-dependent deacylase [Desulfobacterales bacterium]|jgi:NAD-dependent deacetylase|nr:NAD-dependent deacylase [Desulfobacterales bacterium]
MIALIKKVAGYLASAGDVVALTGAGVSVESGIPPFRGKGGVWERFDPMEYASIQAFEKDPAKVWRVLLSELKRVVDKAEPNSAHKGLAKLEKIGILKTVITQNVDGLHQKAGNTDVIEFHGNFAWHRCMKCDNRTDTQSIKLDQIPPKCHCGGIFRPECVFFGEMIPLEAMWRSRQAASNCDIMLVMGTSANVQPAAYMPIIAKKSGAKIIEINTEATPLTENISDHILLGKAGEIMNLLITEIENCRQAELIID